MKNQIDNGAEPQNENTRIMIMLGVIATVLGVLALSPPPILFGLFLLYLMMSLTYIMMCGVYYCYPTKERKEVGMNKVLERIRKLSYNATIKSYWFALLALIYLIVMEMIGINTEGATTIAYIASGAIAIIAGTIYVVRWLMRKPKKA